MDYRMIKTAADRITMSAEMKERLIRNCRSKLATQMEDKSMKHHKTFRKPAAALAALAICLVLSVSAVAASGVVKGYFRDITNWQGAIVGTSYEQADNEIGMSVTINGNELTVLATFFAPQEFPYREIEKLGIAAYQLFDTNGKTVKEGSAESVAIVKGQTTIPISLEEIHNGSYKLVVTAFVAEKKAEQPLQIHGHWECDFTK